MKVKRKQITSIDKERMIKEIKLEMKGKKDCKFLSSLFLIADYLLNNGEQKYKAEEYEASSLRDENRSKEGSSELIEKKEEPKPFDRENEFADGALSIALYILLSFDWSVFQDILKDILKEDTTPKVSPPVTPSPEKKSGSKHSNEILVFLIQILAKGSNKNIRTDRL